MNPSAYLLEGAPNFRDFGGHKTTDGRHVRTSRLYRSELLLGLKPRDLETLAALDIGLVCDLRSPGERERLSNEWPAHRPAEILALDIDAELSAVQPDKWGRRLADPAFTATHAHAALADNYRRMPTSFARDLRALFQHLAERPERAILVHCAAGKDRTGFVCAMLLWALGVPREAILDDYLLTNQRYSLERLISARGRFLPDFEMTANAQATLRVLASVHTDFLHAALDAACTEFGNLDAYLERACELTPARRAALHGALLLG